MARSKDLQPPKKLKASKEKPDSGTALGALQSLDSLLLLAGIFADEAGLAFRGFLQWLAREGASEPRQGLPYYRRWWQAVMETQEFARHPRVGNGLQDYWLERLLDDPNAFHRKAELAPGKIGAALSETYLRELECFRRILKTDWAGEAQKGIKVSGEPGLPSWDGIGEGAGEEVPHALQARKKIKEMILSGSRNGYPLVTEIAQHFHENGWGLFGRYRAFRWQVDSRGLGRLAGVEAADPIRLDNLVGYDEQRKPLLENIEAFVAGKPANNVLIYGERGTGKSSTVKALLNAYQDKGLRLVEVHPSHLNDYQEILPHLRGRGEKFILFVDDLSFEENETSYKGLKALLEGTVEATPANVILIATSNRRHLIREFFDDRAGGLQKDGEIHGADTVEEKLSLSDRFGLVVSFYSPDQETYLRMVENWARAEGIRMPLPELHRRAVQWEKSNNVRSGRTARQFINDLKGKV